MKSIKTIIIVFFVSLFCINADCNKINEVAAPSNYYFIEGRLIKNCTDSTPIRNTDFSLNPMVYNNAYVVSFKTDDNGYFKIKTNCPSGNMSIAELNGSPILDEIPAGKYLNLGNVVINNEISAKIIYNNYSQLSTNDSLIIYINNPTDGTSFSILNSKSDLVVKNPFNSKEIRTIRLRLSSLFTNKSSKSLNITLYKNNTNNIIGKKNLLFTVCGTTQEIVF